MRPDVGDLEGPAAVATSRCGTYEPTEVRAALDEVLAPLGGMKAFVRAGERIALKPNLLMAAAPGAGITTHPSVVGAVAEAVREAGAVPFVVESPGAGIPHTAGALRWVYRKTGLLALAEDTGLELSFATDVEPLHVPGAVLVKRMEVLRALLDADGIISLPKLKTHNYQVYTGAVKNLFGCIPGYAKPGYHAKLADPGHFADMLLDVCAAMAPRLSLMDAVVGLEGEGPGTGGRPREVGALLASRDPVALDRVACRIVGIDERSVPVLQAAERRGLARLDRPPAVAGVPVEALAVSGFLGAYERWTGGGFAPSSAAQRLFGWALADATSPRPRPRRERCTGCATCERACPTGAIVMRQRLAVVEDGSCIRCYCCHELCPDNAVDLEPALLGRLARAVGFR